MVVKMDKIITNKIKCRKCGDVIESVFTHDLKRCKCGAVEIDGGKEYLRRSAKSIDDFIELSTVINADEYTKDIPKEEIQDDELEKMGIGESLYCHFDYSLKNEILLIQKVRAGELQLPIDCLQDEIDADINTLWRCGKITDAESAFLKKVLDV